MDDRYCKICKKSYSSYKSLWNHNKKFHTLKVSKSNPKVIQKNNNVSESDIKITFEILNENNFKCKFCDKIYKYKQGKYKHEQICKNKDELKEDNKIIAKLEEDLIELKNKFNELLQTCKIHPKTLQKINKSIINNNINIIKFGTEELDKIFTEAEMLKIYNRKMCSIEESVKTLHFNDKRPEYIYN